MAASEPDDYQYRVEVGAWIANHTHAAVERDETTPEMYGRCVDNYALNLHVAAVDIRAEAERRRNCHTDEPPRPRGAR